MESDLELLAAIIDVKNGKFSQDDANRKLREALLRYGSETDDNLQCVDGICWENGELYVKGGGSVADALWALEDDRVYDVIMSMFEGMTRRQAEDLLRLCTLVFSALKSRSC